MSSSTLVPHYSGATSYTYTLVSESATGAKWMVADRALCKPQSLELTRKIGPPTSKGNDHVILRLSRSEAGTGTGTPISTAAVTLDISIPRDTTALDADAVNNLLGALASLINQYADTTAYGSRTAVKALLSGGTL